MNSIPESPIKKRIRAILQIASKEFPFEVTFEESLLDLIDRELGEQISRDPIHSERPVLLLAQQWVLQRRDLIQPILLKYLVAKYGETLGTVECEILADELCDELARSDRNNQLIRHFHSWLYRVASRRAIDRLRRLDVRKRHLAPLPVVTTDSPLQLLEREERSLELHEAIAQLPEPMGTIIRLRFFEGQKFDEISELLNLPRTTVHRKCAEAIDLLRTVAKIDLVD
jgi:RNA polymerase sigma factor (sigma-70 family)